LVIAGTDLIVSLQWSPLAMLVLFILFTALIDLIMVSSTAKWSFMAFIFVPLFSELGIGAEITQCAYRIGDSASNAITPFMFYMPLVLTYMQQYDRQSNYASLLRYTWRYSVYILLAWTLFFVLWYQLGIPFGL
jgi:aminobenzoyl-glutamate transport protein